MRLVELAIDKARLTVSVMLFLLLAGALSYASIPKEAEPDIQIPTIYVSLSYSGISPEDSERLLLRPMETALKSVSNVKEITSTAYQGGGNVIVEFEAGGDLDTALEDVRAKVSDAKRELPQGADEPGIFEINLSEFPVLVITLSGNLSEQVLVASARKLRDAVEEVPGVLEANLQGARDDMVEAIVDPTKLTAYGINVDTLGGLVSANNQLVAAGTLEGDEGKYAIKIPALLEDLNEIANLPIVASGDAVVTARELATIRPTFADAESITRLNGEPAIAIEVVKRTGANLIATVDAAKAIADAAAKDMPPGVTVSYSQDKSTDIRQLLSDLQNSVLTAVILVFIIILWALSARSSIIIGLAIPVSFLVGILALQMMGLTVNLVVLFSLILAVGMLVDDAIIVTEYAERRMSEGLDRKAAFTEASHRMAGPVIASTMTRVAAFSPLLFWPGIVGEFMKYLPLTLIVTLSASLMYSLIFAPTLGAIFGKPATEGPHRDGAYIAIVRQAVRYPIIVLLLAAALLYGVIAGFGRAGNGTEFFPNVEPSYGQLSIAARGNLSLQEKDRLVREVEERVVGWPGLESVYTRVGSSGGGASSAFGGGGGADEIGSMQFEFLDWRERKPAFDILRDMRAGLSDFSGIEISVDVPEAGPPTGAAIQVILSAADPRDLDATALMVAEHLRSYPEVVDISDGLPLPGVDWEIRIDREEAAKAGVGAFSIGTAVQLVTTGLKLTDYRPAGAEDAVDITLRLPEDRRTLAALGDLRVQTPGGPVPISNFVELVPTKSVGTLTRIDSRRTITVTAGVKEGVQVAEVQARVAEGIAALAVPETVSWKMGGSDEESAQAQAFLGKAFGAAIFLIFVVLLAQFNRFVSVALVLSAALMSTIGVFLGLLIMGQPFSIVMSGIGVIALAGIVVNNNIVLIDAYHHHRAQGMDKLEAVIQTCRERARPVVLTAATAIFGVLPIAFGLNLELMNQEVTIGAPSTQWWIALSSAIVFGLAFSTILTLVVTPSALMVFTFYKDYAGYPFRRFVALLLDYALGFAAALLLVPLLPAGLTSAIYPEAAPLTQGQVVNLAALLGFGLMLLHRLVTGTLINTTAGTFALGLRHRLLARDGRPGLIRRLIHHAINAVLTSSGLGLIISGMMITGSMKGQSLADRLTGMVMTLAESRRPRREKLQPAE
jgi:multidrug efflux pump